MNFKPSSKTEKDALRLRCLTDKLVLSQVLGYDFVESTHAELFDQFPTFDNEKPWAEQSDQTKRMILWPRGHYKSTAAVVTIIQAVLNFPDLRVLIMQGSLKNTRRMLAEIASHFLGTASTSLLIKVFPEACHAYSLNKQGKKELRSGKSVMQSTAESFTLPNRVKKQLAQASVTVASPRSTKTGQHYDIAFFDDLVNDQNYRSEDRLQKTYEDYLMCQPLLDPPFYCVLTGTRYALLDLYGRLLTDHGTDPNWVISIKTCYHPDGSLRFPRSQTADARWIGFTDDELATIKKNSPEVFAGQYLNEPISLQYREFVASDILPHLVVPVDNLSRPCLFLDLATGQEGQRDDCVLLAAATDDHGTVYITHGRGGRWDTATAALSVVQMTVDLHPLMVYLERSAAGITFRVYLETIAQQQGVFVPVDFLPVNNQQDAKTIRISSLKGYLENQRLKFYGLECWDALLAQWLAYSGAKHGRDDYIDTVALACAQMASTTTYIKKTATPEIPNFLEQLRANRLWRESQDSEDAQYPTCGAGW